MRKSPEILALSLVLITIFRVASFIYSGIKIGWTGIPFSIGLAVGVFIVAFFMRYNETRLPAIVGAVFFLSGDLLFNEMEVIRVLSAGQLTPPDSNFLGMNQETLTNLYHFTGLVFGAFPTVATFLLGWLQSGADKVKDLKSPKWITDLQKKAVGKIFSYFTEESENEGKPENEEKPGEEKQERVRWEDLNQEMRAWIARASLEKIAGRFNVTRKTAYNWKKRIKKGI